MTLSWQVLQRLYVTMFPCNECAKLLIQAGITEVVFYEVGVLPPATIFSKHLG